MQPGRLAASIRLAEALKVSREPVVISAPHLDLS